MRSGKTSRHNKGGDHSLRIIGGQWRGRRLQFPDLPGLRPTGDRTRETLFNWLAPVIVDAHCLDLFAGSGALGLEAVSRGAASATLLDLSTEACRALLLHRQTLGAENSVQVLQADTLAWLRQTPARAFDILFIDPPFDSGLLSPTIELLAQPGWLARGARIYLESPRRQVLPRPADWQLLRSVETGQVQCQLLEFSGS